MFYVVIALILFKLFIFQFISKYIQRPSLIQIPSFFLNKQKQEENRMNSCYYKFKLMEPNENDIIPSKRSGHRAVIFNDNLYIWGGYSPRRDNSQFDLYAQLWKYNIFTNKWSLLETSG